MAPFFDRLAAACVAKQSIACVGLDPRWESLPEEFHRRGDDLAARAAAYSAFCRGVIDVVAPLVPVVKPQSAFFEQLGPAGGQALAEVIQYARTLGLLVLLDVKRGDIGSTATAYAAAYLGDDSPWGADAVTVNPYLGRDSLTPFLDRASAVGGGVFVLVKTSNPGSRDFQDLRLAGAATPSTLYEQVGAAVEQASAAEPGERGYGCCGAVVGATHPEQLAALRAAMPHVWILAPGFGAQGGSAADVAAGFDASGLGLIVNSSRGVIFAHASERFAGEADGDWHGAVRAAATEMTESLRAVAPASKHG